MTITLTEAAAEQIRSQIAKRGKGLGLRVGVRNVGCSGFAYTFNVNNPDVDSTCGCGESFNLKAVADRGTSA